MHHSHFLPLGARLQSLSHPWHLATLLHARRPPSLFCPRAFALAVPSAWSAFLQTSTGRVLSSGSLLRFLLCSEAVCLLKDTHTLPSPIPAAPIPLSCFFLLAVATISHEYFYLFTSSSPSTNATSLKGSDFSFWVSSSSNRDLHKVNPPYILIK